MNPQTGKYLIAIGLVIVIAGILIYYFHNKLTWLGRLPGDIRITKGNVRFYFPIVSMLLISLIVTLLINIFRK